MAFLNMSDLQPGDVRYIVLKYAQPKSEQKVSERTGNPYMSHRWGLEALLNKDRSPIPSRDSYGWHLSCFDGLNDIIMSANPKKGKMLKIYKHDDKTTLVYAVDDDWNETLLKKPTIKEAQEREAKQAQLQTPSRGLPGLAGDKFVYHCLNSVLCGCEMRNYKPTNEQIGQWVSILMIDKQKKLDVKIAIDNNPSQQEDTQEDTPEAPPEEDKAPAWEPPPYEPPEEGEEDLPF